jgi:DNA-binding SARP family transcriptional activator
MPLEFRVLGPLEVRRDGARLPLALKQRAFLAMLLIDHGRVVSVDRLIEGVWPGSTPANARHALEMHASRLRRLLGGEARLVSRSPGYVLDADPRSIDSIRFEHLLGETRELVGVDPAKAASRASDALALWRGSALADFTFHAFAAETIARLEELRLEAEEERVEAELALGRASELVGELEALVAAEPLRERRRGQLMLALYRAGRQADALAAFRDARRHLRDTLGLEPSRALRDLERAILEQDPTLANASTERVRTVRSRRPASVVAVDLELPLDLDPEEHARLTDDAVEVVARVAEYFDAQRPEPLLLLFTHEDHVERARASAAELGRAIQARIGVASGDALVAPGEVGGPLVDRARRNAREQAALEGTSTLGRREAGPFVDRREELVRLRGLRAAVVVGPPGIGKSRLAAELGLSTPTVFGRCASYGSEVLAPLREVVGALGEATGLDEIPAPEVPLTFRLLCERAAPLLVVFDDVQWAGDLVLETIEHLAAQSHAEVCVVCLAREELLEERPDFLSAAERLELGPLADEDAAALAGALGADDPAVAERAEGNPLFIEQLLVHATETSEALPTTLRSLLAARLDWLSPVERLTIEGAAVIGREFDRSLLAGLLRSRDPRTALASLVRRDLLEPALPTMPFEERLRFRHSLIREAAYESIVREERSLLHERLADLLDGRGAGDELVGFHLEQAAKLRSGPDRYAQRLAEDAGRRLGRAGAGRWKRGDTSAGSQLLRRAAELLPASDPQRPELLCELGCALNTAGEQEQALCVLDEARAVGDRRIRLRAELEQAAVSALADPAGAGRLLELAHEAIPVFEAIGDERSLGRALMLSGWVLGGALGRHAEWLEAAERARVHYERAGWPATTSIGHIATALYLGPTPVLAAIARCNELLDVELDDLAAEASVSAHLGGLLAMEGQFEPAATCLQRARMIYSDLGRQRSLLLTCGPIEAHVARLRGALEEAVGTYRRTCEALTAERWGFHLVTQAAELADVLCELGRYDEAELWTSLAEEHARRSDREGWITTLIARAQLLVQTREVREAEARAREAVELADLTDELSLRGAARRVLAEALQQLGLPEAAAEFDRALAEYERKGNIAAASNLRQRIAAATFSHEAP